MVSKSDFKNLVVAGLLIMIFLIFLAYMAPYAYKYVSEGPDSINYTLSDVPGGGIVTGLAFVIIILALVAVAIIKVVDLV